MAQAERDKFPGVLRRLLTRNSVVSGFRRSVQVALVAALSLTNGSCTNTQRPTTADDAMDELASLAGEDDTSMDELASLAGEDDTSMDELASLAGEDDTSMDELASLAGEDDVPAGEFLTLEQARKYAIILANRDRAQHGLGPVVYDEIATRAGQRHAQDMGTNGFTAHWGTDGSVPEERYTEAGGEDDMAENAHCIAGGGKKFKIQTDTLFPKALLEEAEQALMNSPGHRKTILTSMHNRLGIGLVGLPRKAYFGANLVELPGMTNVCMAQEFVTDYGTYSELPREASIGDQITVAGEIHTPYVFGAVGISRIDPASPISYDELMQTHTYKVPKAYALYFPKGFVTPKPVTVHGNRFTIDLVLDDNGQPGRYGISIWAKLPGETSSKMISLRMIDVN